MTGVSLPSNIDIARARLPATYEHAKVALASCDRLDECQNWASKAEALASYAKMADDDSLRQLADRIQARAVRRMGELLKQHNEAGKRTDKPDMGDHTRLTQKEIAEGAGISKHRQVQAVRVANVPPEKFEAAIGQPKPATVTQLSKLGKKIRTAPESSKHAAHLISAVNVSPNSAGPKCRKVSR
jgi:hypothetical protein